MGELPITNSPSPVVSHLPMLKRIVGRVGRHPKVSVFDELAKSKVSIFDKSGMRVKNLLFYKVDL